MKLISQAREPLMPPCPGCSQGLGNLDATGRGEEVVERRCQFALESLRGLFDFGGHFQHHVTTTVPMKKPLGF